jgi:hypothetical protein
MKIVVLFTLCLLIGSCVIAPKASDVKKAEQQATVPEKASEPLPQGK